MKNFVVLGAALIMLLFGITTSVEVTGVENSGVMVCEDVKPDAFPYN